MNFNFNVEKSLGNSAALQVAYVGSLGRKMSVMENINQNGAFPPNIRTRVDHRTEEHRQLELQFAPEHVQSEG